MKARHIKRRLHRWFATIRRDELRRTGGRDLWRHHKVSMSARADVRHGGFARVRGHYPRWWDFALEDGRLNGTRPFMVIVDELEGLLQDMDPTELAKGRAWVAQWAAEDYPGMDVVDLGWTDGVELVLRYPAGEQLPDQIRVESRRGSCTLELTGCEPGKPLQPGRVTGLEVSEKAVLVSIDAPGGAITGLDDLREPLL